MLIKKEFLIKNIRGDFGKGIIIATASILYAIFRLFNILDAAITIPLPKSPLMFLIKNSFLISIFLNLN